MVAATVFQSKPLWEKNPSTITGIQVHWIVFEFLIFLSYVEEYFKRYTAKNGQCFIVFCWATFAEVNWFQTLITTWKMSVLEVFLVRIFTQWMALWSQASRVNKFLKKITNQNFISNLLIFLSCSSNIPYWKL